MKLADNLPIDLHVLLESQAGRRFRRLIRQQPNGCWTWAGKHQRNGYAKFAIAHATNCYSHRWIYEAVHGAIPEGLEIDHLCRNRGCVNPSHLEAVPRRVNLLRGATIPAAHTRKTHCPSGHAYDAGNSTIAIVHALDNAAPGIRGVFAPPRAVNTEGQHR